MNIDTIYINNYRHLDDINIKINDIVSIIGPNNIGKSSILEAINIFCDPVNRIPNCDFNEIKGNPDIEMIIEFNNLSEEAKEQYGTRLLDNERLVVKKIWKIGESKPEFFSKEFIILDEQLSDVATNWKEIKANPIWIERASNAGVEFKLKNDHVIPFVSDYIQEHRDEFKWTEGWNPNPSGLPEILNHHMPEVIFIRGLMDANQEISIKGGSIINKIMNLIISDALENDEDAKDLSKMLEKLISRFSQTPLEGEARIKCIESLEKELSKNMPMGMESIKFVIDAYPVSLSEVIQKSADITIDDGTKTPVSNKGHGMQRATIFSLLRTYSLIQRKTPTENGNISSKKYLFLIEEPELFLHPQAQRLMASSFADLAIQGNQVVFSSHSPVLIDLSEPEKVCILQKYERKVMCKQLREKMFDEASERKKFKMLEYLNPHRSELFFSKKAVFVEGESDRIILEMIGDYLSIRNPETTIIQADGKDNLLFYIELAKSFDLNYTVMHDLDAKNDDIKDAPDEKKYECSTCFEKANSKHKSLKRHPKLNEDIEKKVPKDQLITWYPDINKECKIPKGYSKSIAAKNWCIDVREGREKIPSKLKSAVEIVYTLPK